MGTRRVGHAGTLDPLATGVLVVAVGAATRFLNYLPLEPKVYDATITFGRATSTYDGEGETMSSAPVPDDMEARLLAAIPDFVGDIQQVPPIYSAIKREGQPLYAYARRGETVTVEARPVSISEIRVLEIGTDRVRMVVTCGGGTYIRSLAHDLGAAVGCGAYLSDLRRTAVGEFTEEIAVSPEASSPADLIPLQTALATLPQRRLTLPEANDIRHGRPIPRETAVIDPVVLIHPSGEVAAIGIPEGGLLHPKCVVPEVVDGLV